jgi:hypothetical protein
MVQRIQLLNLLGYTVMVSDYTRYFSLRAYFRQYTKLQIGIVVGMINMKQIFDEDSYRGVEGGILEGFGKLFPDNTCLFVYPELDPDGEISDFDDIRVPEHLRFLLAIYSREILKQLPNGRGGWETYLPAGVADEIVREKLFGFKD